MRSYHSYFGIVLKKRKLLKDNRLVTILSEESGKIVLTGFGIRSLLSKRLSHVETGNYIKFSYTKKESYYILGETELVYGHSKIKSSVSKMNFLYLILIILDKIIPEGDPEALVFDKTLLLLKRLNNKERFTLGEIKTYLTDILIDAGFLDLSQS